MKKKNSEKGRLGKNIGNKFLWVENIRSI